MTAPRQVRPGAAYLVTRRCVERRFFLRPSTLTNAVFRYVLAVSAARHGIRLHAFCVLSNHFHLVLTDPAGQLPAFERDLSFFVARATNAALGRCGYFWDAAGCSVVVLEDQAAILEKIVYVLANPVAAGLVRCATDWPGLWSEPLRIGGAPVAVERPAIFFREAGPLPAVAQLELHLPEGFASATGFIQLVASLLRQAEERAATTHAASGGAFLGVTRVLTQHPFARPPAAEARRGLRPRFATRDPSRRVEAVRRLKAFAQSYREALAEWRKGFRSVVFPHGTYWMRVLHAAQCAPAC